MLNNKVLHQYQTLRKWEQPQLFDGAIADDRVELAKLIDSGRINQFFDQMQYAVDELYDIAYPHEKDLPIEQKKQHKDFSKRYTWPMGTFVYFPWDKTLVRFPKKDELRSLRTSRNRNLITSEEQRRLYDVTILVAGLSVGSNIVEALVSMGIGGTFILADMDVIEPSNLNRIRAPYYDVGVHKADAIAMRMSHIDPYLNFVLLRDGITDENLQSTLDIYKPMVVIDEMDQVKLKIRIRKEAKKRNMPVLSAADDGDSTLLDIERYDLDSEYPMLHGLVPDDILARLESDEIIPRQQLGLLIGKYFIGSEHIPLRMYQSLNEIGKTLPSWPQLGGAAAQSGLAVAYALRQIILNLPLKQGRFVIGPDQILNPELEGVEYSKQLAQFKQKLDSFKL